MKKSSIYKGFLLLGMFSLTACGYSLKEVFRGDEYNSPEFSKNYYKVWDKDLNYHNESSKVINKSETTRVLDRDTDFVFERYSDRNFEALEPNYDKYVYEYDRESHLKEEETRKCYGPSVSIAKDNESFRYGYISKLFDGQFFCNGDYEKARVQIDEQGFATKFSKEYSFTDEDYFGLNLKGAIEFRRDGESIQIAPHTSRVELTINFYIKSDNGYYRVPVSHTFDVPTNTGDSLLIRDQQYAFIGFKLNDAIKINRCAGISFEYRLVQDLTLDALNAQEKYQTNPLKHSLLLYEVVMPNSIWH